MYFGEFVDNLVTISVVRCVKCENKEVYLQTKIENMDQSQIINAIKTYLDEESSDYAVMITGEWGSGKTYLFNEEIKPIIKAKNHRCIHISLIGLNSEETLSRKIFEKINPFYQTIKKSQIACEADALDQILNEDKKEESGDISLGNIVFCFDDLERIKPEFFETAMGYINTFIEHKHVKCMFLCNEEKLSELIPKYKEIKEKYVRYTYLLKTDIRSVLESGLGESKLKEYFDEANTSIIVDMFKKGRCNNVRTLLFVLSLLNLLFQNFDVIMKELKSVDNEYLKELIIRFLCFVSIEQKNGRKKELLDKISVAIVTKNPLDLFDEGFEIDFSEDNNKTKTEKENTEEEKAELERKEIEGIVQQYFSDNPNSYYQFLSISDYVTNGILVYVKFKKELNRKDSILLKTELRKRKEEIIALATNPYKYSNKEFIEKINLLPNEVESGIFDLKECLQLYSNLLWLSSFNITGFEFTEEISAKFERGAEKYIEKNNPSYIPHLTEFTDWSGADKFVKKFRNYRDFIEEKNESLLIQANKENTVKLVEHIKNDSKEDVYNYLTDSSSTTYLSKGDARPILDALMTASPDTTSKILNLFSIRYARYSEGNIVSQTPDTEKEFILELHSLIKDELGSLKMPEKKLSYIPINLLGDLLEKLIVERQFNKKI